MRNTNRTDTVNPGASVLGKTRVLDSAPCAVNPEATKSIPIQTQNTSEHCTLKP